MKIQVEGFDEVHRNLENILNKAKKIEGDNKVPSAIPVLIENTSN